MKFKLGKENPASKLNDDIVRKIRSLYNDEGGYSHRELAKMYDVSHVTIGRILRNECWAHVLDKKKNLAGSFFGKFKKRGVNKK